MCIGFASAATLNNYFQSVTVTGNPALKMYFDTVEVPLDGTMDWGLMDPGASQSKSVSVENVGNTALTVSIIAALPLGWTETWSMNNTVVEPTFKATAPLTLTVPADALAGDYKWAITLKGT